MTTTSSRSPSVLALAALFLAGCENTAAALRAAPNRSALPDHATVTAALREVVAETNGGFGLQMWATIVDRDGVVHVVARSGADRGDQWPGSRVISAQKANTANAFSLPGLSLSTANLFAAVQPGNSLFGLQESNPVDTTAAYAGDAAMFGTAHDPLVGHRIGGVNVFGGGLALYGKGQVLLGGIGLSGDSSVADHVIAWKLRKRLGLDFVPGGVSPTKDDNMVIDFENGKSASGWGHAATTPEATKIVNALPTTHPIAR
ncbi:MAG: heme-binding protein [Planctomycetes bacterium]|nr:heme-binding protein [Planctomycetota bacterium]